MSTVKIVCEEAYAESIWCKQLLEGLIKELKKRRISFEQTTETIAGDSVYLIGISNDWLQKTISRCNVSNRVPIVLTVNSMKNISGKYHLICPDMENAARQLRGALEKAGRYNLAIYGAKASDDLDRCRNEIFSGILNVAGTIFNNTGNLESCFRSFLPKAGLYDAVLCINGYAATSLVKKLEKEAPELLEYLFVFTFEEVLKHSKYNQWISVIDYRLDRFGNAAAQIGELAQRIEHVSNMRVEMEGALCEIPTKLKQDNQKMAETALYEDPEIIHMAKIEQLLQNADDMDHHILAMLLGGAKYSEIADSCYMTEGNVKYRVKKYMSTCDCKTKKELLELLQEYLQ